MLAQRGPFAISKNGKPAAVLVPAPSYEAADAWKLENLQDILAQSRADMAAGKLQSADEVYEGIRDQLRNA